MSETLRDNLSRNNAAHVRDMLRERRERTRERMYKGTCSAVNCPYLKGRTFGERVFYQELKKYIYFRGKICVSRISPKVKKEEGNQTLFLLSSECGAAVEKESEQIPRAERGCRETAHPGPPSHPIPPIRAHPSTSWCRIPVPATGAPPLVLVITECLLCTPV